ncbi:MAG: FAD-dependent oxidoreductase [Verrucomicrobia bacterium]|nr:FAD-dependent oxidoreductase [Verrucomicrobiota bacterium]
MDTKDVLVIGAGISGLLCAAELHAAGMRVAVLDKGRGPGGRMSTRRGMGATRIDHGAQFFTVRDARWRAWVDRMLAAGAVREWFRQAPWDSNPEGYPRYCGVDGMNAVPKFLARELDVTPSVRLLSLQRVDGVWLAESDGGNRYCGRELVLSTPLPQAWALLDTSGLRWVTNGTRATLEAVRYEKGLATLVRLKGASAVPAPGCLKLDEDALVWVADNQQKGISSEPALTLHASSAFAERHWDSSDEERGGLMLEAAKPWLGEGVAEFTCHRWGYTLPLNPFKEPCYRNGAMNLTLAGDAFGGPRVEGAALSGLAAAEVIRSSLATAKGG